MTSPTDFAYPPSGVKASGGYALSGSGLWLPLSGVDQGDGTVALKVTGAGASPAATALKLADGGGGGYLASVSAAGKLEVDTGLASGLTNAELRATPVPVDSGLVQALTNAQLRASAVGVADAAVLTQLDITLSALRDAITKTGATSKTLADVVAALAATLNVSGSVAVSNLPATQPVSGTVAVSSTPGLTDTQLRASAVPVSTPHLNSTTDSVAVAGTVAVSSMPAPPHLSSSTDSVAVTGTVNAEKVPVTLGGPVLISSSGDNIVYTPTAGKTPRLKWIYLTAADDSTPCAAIVRWKASGGTTTDIYDVDLTSPGVFGRSTNRSGPGPDAVLIVNLSGARNVKVNLDMEEF